MKKLCAWCGKEMEGVTGGREGERAAAITHGICGSCSDRMLTAGKDVLQEFLDGLGVPILLVENDVAVNTANELGREMLGKRLSEIEGRRGGEVIGCVNARLPGGCGRQVNCRICVIRTSVEETMATGRGVVRREAWQEIEVGQERKKVCIEISTEKVGDVVLLRIDDLRMS